MNQYEELCKLASNESWCWKLFCTTCGHIHFRYAFSELAAGRSPDEPNWIIHNGNTKFSNSLGPLPRFYTEEQKHEVSAICAKANLSSIANVCKFPDWLGYLGLILKHMYTDKEPYRELSESWVSQLSDMVPPGSAAHNRLSEITKHKKLLRIQDLELCESSMVYKK